MQADLRGRCSALVLLLASAATVQEAGAYHLVGRGPRGAIPRAALTVANDSALEVPRSGASLRNESSVARWYSVDNTTAGPDNATAGSGNVTAGSGNVTSNQSIIDIFRYESQEMGRMRRWGPPIWWQPEHHPKSSKDSFEQFWDIPGHKIAALLASAVLFLTLDQWVIQVHIRHSVLQPLFWVTVALLFNMFIWGVYGGEQSMEWATGYIYEWVFQVDNLLVCHIIFKKYKVPRRLVDKALSLLLVGQLLVRLLFYLGVAHIVHRVVAFRYIAGFALLYGGYATMREPLGEVDDSGGEAWATLAARWLLEHSGVRAAAADSDWRYLIPSVTTLLVVDLVLGADCAIAKIEEIPYAFWNITSSAAALFGLRASYRLLANAADTMAYIQYGIAVVLIFIGLELLLMTWIDIGSFASISVCLGLMVISALASLVFRPPGTGSAGAALVSDEVPKEAAADPADTKVPSSKAG